MAGYLRCEQIREPLKSWTPRFQTQGPHGSRMRRVVSFLGCVRRYGTEQRELTAEASGDVPRTFRVPGGLTEKTQEYCGQLPGGR
eukprot:4645849-Alexandrium_andersonii.AAC.1